MPHDPQRPRLERSTPTLAVADYSRAKTFYVDKLGYQVIEEGGDPAKFGIFARDGSTLFVNGWDGARPAGPDVWTAYIHVEGIDALAQEFSACGVGLTRAVRNRAYGMREFEIADPDGNILCFGEDVDAAASQSGRRSPTA